MNDISLNLVRKTLVIKSIEKDKKTNCFKLFNYFNHVSFSSRKFTRK